MRAELEAMGVAGANSVSAEAAVPESFGLPEVVLVLLVSGMGCVLLTVADRGGTGTLVLGAGLLAGCGVGLAVARPTPGALLMFTVAAAAVGVELLACAGRGLYAGTAGVSLSMAGLELAGWPPGARGGLIVILACGAALMTLLASSRSWRRARDLPFDRSRGLLGRGAVVLRDGTGTPCAVVAGELWSLRADGRDLRDGEMVRVTRVEGEVLIAEHATTLRAG